MCVYVYICVYLNMYSILLVYVYYTYIHTNKYDIYTPCIDMQLLLLYVKVDNIVFLVFPNDNILIYQCYICP